MAEDKIFAEGFSFKRRDNAPEFVVGRQSIKVDEAVAWLKAHAKNGWVNIDIKQARGGNYYCELDTWEAPKTNTNTKTEAKKAEVVSNDDLPF
jgi:hypothetical protein